MHIRHRPTVAHREYRVEIGTHTLEGVDGLVGGFQFVQWWVGGWSFRYLATKRERGPVRVPGLLEEDFAQMVRGFLRPGTMMEHVTSLPSRSVGAVLGDLDVSTDAAWSTGHSAIHSLVT